MLRYLTLIILLCCASATAVFCQNLNNVSFSSELERIRFRPDSVISGSSRDALPFRYMPGLRQNISILGRQENLDINQVMSLCMDSRHDLWIGGYNGEIARYDGQRIHYYHLAPLFANPIEDILEDSKGNIWFGSRAGGIVRYNGIEFDYFGPQSGCSFKVFSFFEDKNGVVWTCTNGDGLIGIRNNQFARVTTTEGLKDPAVTCLSQAADGGACTGYFKRGISTAQHSSVDLPDSTVFALSSTPYGVLAATRQGLCFIPEGSAESKVIVEGTGFLDLLVLPDGSVMCASNGNGIYRIASADGMNWEVTDQITAEQGLSSNRITNLVSDREGNVWVGTYDAGLNLIRPQLFQNFNVETGLVSDRHWSLLRNGNTMLAGYSTEGIASFYISDNGKISLSNPIIKGLTSESTVTEMHKSKDGVIWYASGRDGVVTEKKGKQKRYPFSTARSTQGVKAIAEDSYGRVIMGTWGGLMELSRDSVRPISFGGTTVLNNINDMKSDDRGNIWIASDAGLMCIPATTDSLQERRCIRFGDRITRNGLACQSVLAQGDNVWIGTDGDGIVRISADKALSTTEGSIDNTRIGAGEGLHDLFIMALFHDGNTIWAGTKKGICKLISSPEKGGTWKWRTYGIAEGMLDSDITFNNVTQDSLGRIWWCTNSAISVYDPAQEKPDTIVPAVNIDEIDLFFESVNWFSRGDAQGDARIRTQSSYLGSLWNEYIYYPDISSWNWLPVNPIFSHDQNHLTFRFSGRDWYNNGNLRYVVRMAGADATWIELGSATSITYNSLSPGEYTFMVKAVSSDGTESKTTEYKFCIMPPFWQTTWFIAIVVIVFLFSLYLFYRWRVRKLERERDILELKVEERTEELKKEKNKSENLLLNILPRDTVNELKEKGRSEARIYRNTTVLFSDFSGFTDMTTRIQPAELIESLDSFFNAFDDIADKYGVEKIKTIGDSYMAACGLPQTREDHALRMAAFALEMLDATDHINQERSEKGKTIWPIRIGLHSGPLLAGVVGTKKFAYDIWGDTVNTASRMEGNGEPGRINISIETAMLLKDFFYIAPRGKMAVKGKGEMEMFWLESFKVPFREEGNKRKPNESFRDLMSPDNPGSAEDLNTGKP